MSPRPEGCGDMMKTQIPCGNEKQKSKGEKQIPFGNDKPIRQSE
jgi:hypothetical protein